MGWRVTLQEFGAGFFYLMTFKRLNKETFRLALSKGLGRALQATQAEGCLIDEDAALDASLHNRSYDPQLEGSRALWMVEILTAANAVERFRAPILEALSQASDTWDLDQLCGFAEVFARSGVEEARKALYDILDRKPDSTAPWLAEDQIVRLDGLDGLLYLAEWRGAAIRRGEDDWDFASPVYVADEICGSDVVEAALVNGAAHSPDIRAYYARVQEERRQTEEIFSDRHGGSREQQQAIAVEQVLKSIENEPPDYKGYALIQWGRYASDASLRPVAAAMFSEQEPRKLARYLRVFSRRPLPDFDDRLIDLSDHSDRDVRFGAFHALANNKNAAVRDLAVRRLKAGQGDGDTISLLKHNYEPGDHRLIETLLIPSDNADEMHDLCWGLEEVFHENRTADCVNSMLFAYDHTPCSNCRYRALRLLEVDKAPPEIVEECRFDANPDIREKVAAP